MSLKSIQKPLLGLLFLIFTLSSMSLSAQNYSEYNWLFGNKKSTLTFNKSDARVQLDSLQVLPFGMGGGVVVSDPVTGNLLFYSDGVNVYDSQHELVPGNGTGLNGDSSINRAASVVPMSYTVGEYYLFTNPGAAGAEISYTVLDRNLTGNANGVGPALGDIDVSRLNLSTGLVNPAEAMAVIQVDIDNYWLIAYDRGVDEYMVLGINDGVLDTPNIQRFTFNTVETPAFEPAAFAYHQDSALLAVAPLDDFRNVTILAFDINTGVLSFDQTILNSGNGDQVSASIFDVEWSANGQNLYVSRLGNADEVGNVYQYNLSDTLNTFNAILPSPVFRSFGIQKGPDQNIYHLYQAHAASEINLGVIQEADSTFHVDSLQFNLGYVDSLFNLNAFSAKQFPDFAAPHFESFDSVNFDYIDNCAMLTTKFFSNVDPPAESYQWDFGDGNFSNAINPVHTFQTAGPKMVRLTVTLNEIEEEVIRVINVVDNDLMIDLGADTIRCVGEVFTYDAGAGGSSYFWNTGETTQTIEVDTTGVFSVAVVSAATGCVNYDYVGVVTYGDNTNFRNRWYFGEQAGVDFNDPATVGIDDANLMSSPQGASSVSDKNGDLLFYTNGETIWNKDHVIMSNGDEIGGDANSSQGVMIVPLPGDSSIYYVFTSDPVYGDQSYNMKYSVVDMRRDTARGTVVVKDVDLFTNSTERMTAYGLGGASSWLVGHEFGNNQFRAYPFTSEGIGAPVTSAAGSAMDFGNEKSGRAQMKYATAGSVLAVALQEENDSFLELFSIDNNSGEIEGLVKIDIDEPSAALIYGVEFSGSATKVYVSTNGTDGSALLQFNLDSLFTDGAKAYIEDSKFDVSRDASNQYGALQTGPDNVIYLAIEDALFLGSIGNEEEAGAATFSMDAVDLIGHQSKLGLPNFSQTINNSNTSLGISAVGPCLGQETVFSGSGTSSIDEFYWTFDDGTFSSEASTTHLYNLQGSYNVSLRVTNRCGLDDTLFQTVDIFPIPISPSVPDALSVCNGAELIAAWPTDSVGLSYTWSTGEDTREILVDQLGIVSVFITDSNGCQSDPRDTFVADSRPVVDLGVDQVICQDGELAELNAFNPGSSYTWEIEGVDTGNDLSLQSIDTSVPGNFTYKLTVEDLFNCVSSDSVELQIAPEPSFNLTPTDPAGCGANTGSIEISLSNFGSYSFSVEGEVSVPATTIDGSTYTISNLPAGQHTITVRNTLTGCSNPEVQTLNDVAALFTLDPPSPSPACPSEGELVISLSGVAGNVQYQLFDDQGNQIRTNTATPSPDFTITGLDAGVYSIVVQEQNFPNCVQTFDDITLAGAPEAEFLAAPQAICGSEGEIRIDPVTVDPDVISYFWTGPDVNNPTGTAIIVSAPGTYEVTSSGADYCSVTQSIEVTQYDEPIVGIDPSGEPCDGSLLLTATVQNGLVGNGSFAWDNGLNASQRTVYSSGDYDVTVLDQGTGCSGDTTIFVDVYSEITVFVASSPNCDDNSEVFLDAYANITEDVTFEWTAPSGEILEDQSADIAVSESGNYHMRVISDLSTCVAEDAIDVLVLPIAEEELLLEDHYVFCSEDPDPANNTVAMDPGAFTTFEWTILNDDNLLSSDRILNVSEAGVYEVTVSNGFTCIRDITELVDDCLPRIYAPNVFVPTGLNNEFFVYPNPYVTEFEIEIYSRWGERVYQSNDIAFRWNGEYRGKVMQSDAYAYVMRFKSNLAPQLGVIEQSGSVLILK